MHYYIILTELCNSQCRYCYGKSMKDFDSQLEERFALDFSNPAQSIVDVQMLKRFLAKDRAAVVVFYGGEPLLNMPKLIEIMDNIEVPFRMQTNGKLLDELPAKYANRIGKILISLDGTRERTDSNRGEGTYDTVASNVALIKKNGYAGEIVARMVISFPDIYEQVLALVNAGFTSVHWQLDAGFYSNDFNAVQFSQFVREYNNSILKLVDYWVEQMKRGRVLKLYPFLGIVGSLLLQKPSELRCGAGHSNYALTTGGRFVACPIMSVFKQVIAGGLDSEPVELKKFSMHEECMACDIKSVCGGRCLYWHMTSLWPAKGNALICLTVRHLVEVLQSKIEAINQLLSSEVIEPADFEYEKYFGPEIIP